MQTGEITMAAPSENDAEIIQEILIGRLSDVQGNLLPGDPEWFRLMAERAQLWCERDQFERERARRWGRMGSRWGLRGEMGSMWGEMDWLSDEQGDDIEKVLMSPFQSGVYDKPGSRWFSSFTKFMKLYGIVNPRVDEVQKAMERARVDYAADGSVEGALLQTAIYGCYLDRAIDAVERKASGEHGDGRVMSKYQSGLDFEPLSFWETIASLIVSGRMNGVRADSEVTQSVEQPLGMNGYFVGEASGIGIGIDNEIGMSAHRIRIDPDGTVPGLQCRVNGVETQPSEGEETEQGQGNETMMPQFQSQVYIEPGSHCSSSRDEGTTPDPTGGLLSCMIMHGNDNETVMEVPETMNEVGADYEATIYVEKPLGSTTMNGYLVGEASGVGKREMGSVWGKMTHGLGRILKRWPSDEHGNDIDNKTAMSAHRIGIDHDGTVPAQQPDLEQGHCDEIGEETDEGQGDGIGDETNEGQGDARTDESFAKLVVKAVIRMIANPQLIGDYRKLMDTFLRFNIAHGALILWFTRGDLSSLAKVESPSTITQVFNTLGFCFTLGGLFLLPKKKECAVFVGKIGMSFTMCAIIVATVNYVWPDKSWIASIPCLLSSLGIVLS